jgi:hypothetical protein
MCNIQINVTGGVITCEPSFVRAVQKTQVTWTSNEPFSLTFQALDGSDPWPFQEAPPAQWHGFVGTLKAIAANAKAPAYKYTVNVAGKTLDPIIIVDRTP